MKKISSLIACSITCLVMLCLNSCDKTSDLEKCKADPMCEYFRCNVDGKSWKPYCESSFLGCDAVDVQYYRKTGTLSMIAKNSLNNSSFNLTGTKIYEIGNFLLYSGPNTQSRLKQNNSIDSCTIYYLLDSINSEIIISKIDTINFIIEGEFLFDFENKCNEQIKITNGQFRQHYRF